MIIYDDLCRCISPNLDRRCSHETHFFYVGYRFTIKRGTTGYLSVPFRPSVSSEVCEVINRIRAAYGPIPMKTVADQPR